MKNSTLKMTSVVAAYASPEMKTLLFESEGMFCASARMKINAWEEDAEDNDLVF